MLPTTPAQQSTWMCRAVVAFRVTAQKNTWCPGPGALCALGEHANGICLLVQSYRAGFANLSASSGDLCVPPGHSPCCPCSIWGLGAPVSVSEHNPQFAVISFSLPSLLLSFLPSQQAHWTSCVWGRKHKLLFFILMRQNIRKMQLV